MFYYFWQQTGTVEMAFLHDGKASMLRVDQRRERAQFRAQARAEWLMEAAMKGPN